MHYLEASLRVLIMGLILGGGLPATFALGVRAFSAGGGGVAADGTMRAPNPLLKAIGVALFVLIAVVIMVAILWITRNTIRVHLGVDLFPFATKK
ncbi:MAG: hypothetical protein KIH64_014070 [Mycobacterium sp.]|nr:hypothetical protein [Mycobacterium sp.]